MDRVRETKQNKKTSNCRKQMRGYKVGLSGMKTSESTGRARRVKEMCCQDVGQDTVFVMCHCFQNHRPLSAIDENLSHPHLSIDIKEFQQRQKNQNQIKKKSERERERKRWCEMWYLMVVRVDGWNACLRRSCNIVSPSVLQFHTFCHRSSNSFRLCLISQVKVVGYGFRV